MYKLQKALKIIRKQGYLHTTFTNVITIDAAFEKKLTNSVESLLVACETRRLSILMFPSKYPRAPTGVRAFWRALELAEKALAAPSARAALQPWSSATVAELSGLLPRQTSKHLICYDR